MLRYTLHSAVICFILSLICICHCTKEDNIYVVIQLDTLYAENGYKLHLLFSDLMDSTSTSNIDNYKIVYWKHEINVVKAQLEADEKHVILTTENSFINSMDGEFDNMYTIYLTNLTDKIHYFVDTIIKSFSGLAPYDTANWGSPDNFIIKGTIISQDENPISGTIIRYINPGNDQKYNTKPQDKDDVVLDVICQGDGSFVLKGLPSWQEINNIYDLELLLSSIPGNYEKAILWPLVEPGNKSQTSINMDITLYPVNPETKIEGYILDNTGNPVPLASLISLEITRDNLSRQCFYITEGYETFTEDSNFYYDDINGYYHIQNCLCGGALYRISIIVSGHSDINEFPVNVAAGETTSANWTLTKY